MEFRKIDNLYLVNSNLLIFKINNKLIPEIREPIITIEKLPEFEINDKGGEVVIFLLASDQNRTVLIIQQLETKYIVLFPEEINFKHGYKTAGIWIVDFPEIKLTKLKESKRDELQKIFLEYKNKEINTQFMQSILENFSVLPDNPFITNLILDKLSASDLKNLTILHPDNKNKITNYLLEKLDSEYSFRLPVGYEDKINLPQLYFKIKEIGINVGLANWAARNGHLAVLEWLNALNPPIRADMRGANYAAGNGQLAVLEWLNTLNPPIRPNVDGANYAARNGHLAVLQWLNAFNPPIRPNVVGANWAAGNGHLAVLEWLNTLNPPIRPNVDGANGAARNGHLHVLEWLNTLQPPIRPNLQ